MDYQGFQARLKDLKTLQTLALKRGDAKKASELSEKYIALRERWTNMVSDFCDTSNQLGKSTDAKEPDFTLDQSVSSNEEMKGESDSADDDWNNSADVGESDSADDDWSSSADVGESDSADEDWNSSADVGESDSAAEDMKEESLNNIAEEILESNKGDRKKGGKKREAKCRAAKVCPLPYCKKPVIHLPRHLHNVHHWSKNQSQGSVSRFQLRKKYTFRTNETAKAGNRKKKVDENKPYVDYHKRKVCPVPGCVKIVKRMPPHLKKVHHLEPKSKKYKDLLSRTFAFSNKPYSTKKRREDAYDVKLPEHEVDRKIKVSFVPGKVAYKNEDDGYEKESKDSDLDEGKDEYDKYEDYEEEDKDTSDNEYVTDEHEDSNEPEYMDDSNSDENEPCSDKHAVSDLLDKVCDWLISSDGSHLDTRTAKQHVNQLRRMLLKIDTEENLTSLLDLTLIRDVFMKYAEANYLVGTIKSYLTSLQHFYTYLLAELPQEIPVDCDTLTQLKVRVQRWSSSFKKSSSTRNWQKMEEDRVRLITSEQFQKFEKSGAAREAITLLGQLGQAHNIEITQSHYTLIRDFLLLEISIDNANRAGVLSNMTMAEFRQSMRQDNRFVVSVKKHKTFATHGPAQVVLTDHLFNWIKLFISEVRSTVAKQDAPCLENNIQTVFLSWNGESLESCQINKAIKSIWKKAGMTGPIHSTLMRKGAVTACHDKDKEISEPLAELMAHNVSTANKYYRLTERAKSSVKASQKLGEVMRTGKTKIDQVTSKEPDQQDLSSKEVWGSKAVDEIRSLFSDEILNREISMEIVREKIKSSKILCDEEPKRVLDRARSEWRHYADKANEAREPPTEKDEMADRVNRMFDSSSSVISPTATSSSGLLYKHKVIFSASQVATIHRLCGDMINRTPISRPVIRERLSKDKEGKQLLIVMTLSQIINRIKYERKQKREKQV